MTAPYPYNDAIMDKIRESAADRARIISAIHGMASFLTDNPGVPAPSSVTMYAQPAPVHATPDDVRIAALDRFTAAHHADRYSLDAGKGQRHEYAKLIMHVSDDVQVTYCLSTTTKSAREET